MCKIALYQLISKLIIMSSILAKMKYVMAC